jgi:hypothetical protein
MPHSAVPRLNLGVDTGGGWRPRLKHTRLKGHILYYDVFQIRKIRYHNTRCDPCDGATPVMVGIVCIAWVVRDGQGRAQTLHFSGDRTEVRRQAVSTALRGVLQIIESDAVTA